MDPAAVHAAVEESFEAGLRSRYLERLRLLRAIDRVIFAAQSLDEMAGGCLPLLRELVPCAWAGIIDCDVLAGDLAVVRVDPESGARPGRGWRGPVEWAGAALPAAGKPGAVLIEDIHDQALASPLFKALEENRVSSCLSAPILLEDRPAGFLLLGKEAPGDWSEEDIQAAEEVAGQLSVGIRNLNRYAGLELREVVQAYLVARRTADLEAARAQFQAVFDNSAVGMALLDEEGCIVECSKALQEAYGYTFEELKGMHFSGFFLPEESGLDVPRYLQGIEKGAAPGRMEARHVRKDGSAIWTRLTLSPVRASGLDAPMAILIVEDLTEQKQAQAAMIQAEKLAITGKLAASLAHEINNPLQSSIGCLGLTEEVMAEGGDTSEYLRVATGELERAARIVAQLRDLNQQAPSGRKSSVDLNALLAQTLMLVTRQCKDHNIKVNWSPDPALSPLELSADQMQQVFLNLSLNAIDAMPEGGILAITTQPVGDPRGVRIDFSDTGVGIPPELMHRVFEQFFSTRPDGLGLGLYISKMIVQDHGGTIAVSSRPGEGTTFSIWLPAP